MSSYEHMKVVKLRNLCKSAGLPSTGRKANLIASLRAKGSTTMAEAIDAEISLPGDGASHDESVEEEEEEANSNEILALKLKLELVRENRLAYVSQVSSGLEIGYSNQNFFTHPKTSSKITSLKKRRCHQYRDHKNSNKTQKQVTPVTHQITDAKV